MYRASKASTRCASCSGCAFVACAELRGRWPRCTHPAGRRRRRVYGALATAARGGSGRRGGGAPVLAAALPAQGRRTAGPTWSSCSTASRWRRRCR
ncbi:MAG: hypothetical protein MZW92_79930 [Comamonadaceae bacterium]|nr:hypothetical protein [Comamonadaceae bacterium]